MSAEPASHVMTLKLDAVSFTRLQALRRMHFPPAVNWLPAHLTLFHTLSAAQLTRLAARRAMYEERRPIAMRFTGLESLGRGTAITVESSELIELRSQARDTLAGDFTRQDRQSLRPHVTIQNKVDAATARSLLGELAQTFEPWDGRGVGLIVWRYLGGPWAFETEYAFNGGG